MKKRLRIVRGNDFYLVVPVKNIVFVRDQEGRVSRSELSVPLSECSVLNVNIVCECGKEKATTFSVDGSSLIVKVDSTTPCGWYGIEVTYKLAGKQYRSFECDVFKIVENNGKSFVSGEQYQGERSYNVDTMYTLMSIIDEEDLRVIIGELEREAMREVAHEVSPIEQGDAVGNSGNLPSAKLKDSDCYASGLGSLAVGVDVRTNHKGGFAFGVRNEYDTTGGDGEDDYLVGSVGGGYYIQQAGGVLKIIRKNLLEIWRNGSFCIQVNGQKVRLQDEILRLWTLVNILKGKNIITDNDFVITDSTIDGIVDTYSPVDPRDTTLDEQHFGSAWGALPVDDNIVKPFTGGHGMLSPEEVGEKLKDDEEEIAPITPSYGYPYYGGSLGSYDYIPEEETTH